jgi:lipid A 3-O-deacylase
VLYTLGGPQSIYVQGHVMPGLYEPGGGGPDLGGTLQFRSGLEIGLATAAGLRLGLALDHRSNAGIYRDNPGLETLQIRVSFPAF